MLFSRPFSTALIISFCLHALILFQRPYFLFFKKDISPTNVEIFYLNKPEAKRLNSYKRAAGNKEKEILQKLPKVNISEDKKPPPFIDKQQEMVLRNRENAPKTLSLTKPYLIKPEIVSIKKKISFISVDKDKAHNPSYINYYQVVREKIKHSAYQSYTRSESGEVYLSFVISSGGDLKQTRIVDEKSSFSPYLREIALKSLKNAAPFPSFPKELDYPQLSFNVIVSFEIE